MAAMSHTPGPWRAERDQRGDFRIVYNDKGNWLAEVYSDGEPESAEADAKLIAAAPVLLASLKMARILLANSASYDEAAGHHEDAAYTRRRLVDIDAAIASASPKIAPTAESEPSNVARIEERFA
jgi:hypothetical protein